MDNKKAFRIAFDFAERWKPCPDSLEEWEAAAREIGVICGQNGSDPLLGDLIIAVYNNFDREWKKRKGDTVCE